MLQYVFFIILNTRLLARLHDIEKVKLVITNPYHIFAAGKSCSDMAPSKKKPAKKAEVAKSSLSSISKAPASKAATPKTKPNSKSEAPAAPVITAAVVLYVHSTPYDTGNTAEPDSTRYPSQTAANDDILKRWNKFEKENKGQVGRYDTCTLEKNKAGYYRFELVDQEGDSDIYYSAPDVGVWELVKDFNENGNDNDSGDNDSGAA